MGNAAALGPGSALQAVRDDGSWKTELSFKI